MPKATGGDGKNPRRNVFLLRKRAHRLNPAQGLELDGIKANSPLEKAGHEAKEGFYSIYDAADRQEAVDRFDAWKASIHEDVKREFGQVARMVDRWHKEVFDYFDHPYTNAYVENRNLLIKMANRQGRGYTFDVIRAKALLMRPVAQMAKCPCCGIPYPLKKLLPLTLRVPDGDDLAEITSTITCGNCHHHFHTEIKDGFEKWLLERSMVQSE